MDMDGSPIIEYYRNPLNITATPQGGSDLF